MSIRSVDVHHLHCELGSEGGGFPSDPSHTLSAHCGLACQLQRHLVDHIQNDLLLNDLHLVEGRYDWDIGPLMGDLSWIPFVEVIFMSLLLSHPGCW